MLISHAKKFIFFHMIKTGGRSVTRVLAEYASIDLNNSGGTRPVDPSIKELMERIDKDLENCPDFKSLKPHLKPLVFNIHTYFKNQFGSGKTSCLEYLLEFPDAFRGVFKSFINESYPKVYGFISEHSDTRTGKRTLPPEVFDHYYKFGFVRDPYAWLVSIFFFFREYEAQPFREFLKTFAGFKDFVEFLVAKREENFDGIDFFELNLRNPQKDFFSDEQGNLLVDFIGKLENFNEDFAKVCERIGVPRANVPHLNKSSHGGYLDYYTPETKKHVYSLLEEDFIAFGYDR